MNKNKHAVARRIGYLLLALLLSVAVSLPNYAKVVQLDRLQSGGIADLYNGYLTDFGAQEAHAILPALALPAALTAAGVTSEMAAAAIAAVFTAVAATSLHDVWNKLPPSEKMGWTSETEWALTLGWLSSGMTFDPGDPETPPEPNGSSGNAMIAAILALTTGAGVVGVRDLADCAADLIKFVLNPAGEDANGLPTGLGIIPEFDKRISLAGHAPLDFALTNTLPGFVTIGTEYVQYDSSKPWFAYGFCDNDYFSSFLAYWRFSKSDTTAFVLYPINEEQWQVTLYGDATSQMQFIGYKSDGRLGSQGGLGAFDITTTSVLLNADYDIYIRTSPNVALGQTLASYVDGVWDYGDIITAADQSVALNAPDVLLDMLKDAFLAGAGSSSSQSAINNYVTNNIDNSQKVVSIPSDQTQLGDYDKVVTDPKPNPEPDPDPVPDPDKPGQDPNVTVKDFLELPFELLFPFCLVYDIQLLIEHVAGGAVAMDDSLVFEFNLGFGYFDAPLVVDLTEYRDMQDAFHMAFNVMLVVGLLYFSISLFLKARSD